MLRLYIWPRRKSNGPCRRAFSEIWTVNMLAGKERNGGEVSAGHLIHAGDCIDTLPQSRVALRLVPAPATVSTGQRGMKLGQKKFVHFLKTASKSNSRYLQRQLRHQKQAKQSQLRKLTTTHKALTRASLASSLRPELSDDRYHSHAGAPHPRAKSMRGRQPSNIKNMARNAKCQRK